MPGPDRVAASPVTAAAGETGQRGTLSAFAAPAEATGEGTASGVPTPTLPKGGGAIQGIGEKFAANPVTGTGSMSVPIPTSPARAGFGPQLALSYDSGAGNGPFGFGWALSLPAITRRTGKGLPQYLDSDESDVFILSGSEDLVPVRDPDGTWYEDADTFPGYVVHRYRPRVEGLFARIERWTARATGDVHWRSITRDNVTTLYGRDADSRITDPGGAHPCHVFSWLICQSYDDKGNAIVYEYAAENDDNVDWSDANERNRVRTANRYLKRIKYGNHVSRLIQPDLTQMTWMFEVVFDYHEGHYEELPPDPTRPQAEQHQFVRAADTSGQAWAARLDPFSSYRAGFEVRTHRRCQRVLMFHRFAELGSEPCLVRSTAFDYADLDYTLPVTAQDELAHQGSTRFASFLQSVTQSGHVRDGRQPVLTRDGVGYVTYLTKSLPPLEFTYSKATIQDTVLELDTASLENLPSGIDGTTCQWVDLDGEGISGVLTQQAGAWYYKPNLGEGRFGPLQTIAAQPSLAVNGGNQQLLDLAGDGRLDLASFTGPTPGFSKRTQDGTWQSFRPFGQLPNIPWNDPNLRFIDLDGDGHTDVLITDLDVFTWHPSCAEDGFGTSRRVHTPADEEAGARLVLEDGTHSIYLADMSGDGLSDLVRLRNGEVCYWPNLGYGRFGAKVTMDNAPWFDTPDQFDQQRVRLADIDGSGTNDIIYLARDAARLYFNQSGNRWSTARPLPQFPPVSNLSTVTTADLLGNGTACLVWSSPLPADSRRPLRYIDLMGGKPHLLITSINNLGAETRVTYTSSTTFYLADKHAGTPWITRLTFPVHVVERVDTYDRIGRNHFSTRYAYHHGYFDGVEREFRGFGLVEQWDTEAISALDTPRNTAAEAINLDPATSVPPVLTRTWFHTGAFAGQERISRHLAHEYYPHSVMLPDSALPRTLRRPSQEPLPWRLSDDEQRQAARALKGSILRQEIYGLDGTEAAARPYLVTEHNYTIEFLQPEPDRPDDVDRTHAVFFTHPRETLTAHHERTSDPRISHDLMLDVDDFGNVLTSARAGYGRLQTDPALTPADQAKQSTTLLTYTEQRYTNAVEAADAYRTPLGAEARTFELTGLAPSPGNVRFTFDQIAAAEAAATTIPYEQAPTSGATEKRLIKHTRTLYRRDDLAGPLPLGTVEPLALPFESYSLALTPGLVAHVYSGRVTDAMLADEGRYMHSEGEADWWAPSGQMFYSPGTDDTAAQELACAQQHFFLPRRVRNPFHTSTVSTETFVSYDHYDLLAEETRDALGNRVTAGERNTDPTQPPVRVSHDYRVLQPAMVMDPNRNRAAVTFDALGLVAGTAGMGKPEESPVPGDQLAPGFHADLTQSEIDQFLADPKGPAAAALLDQASTRVVYDIDAYRRDPVRRTPTVSGTLAREAHASDLVPAGGLRIQASVLYSDGFGRAIQKKVQAEPGPTPLRDAGGGIVVGADGQPEMTTGDTNPRWAGSGWTVLNKKRKPVRQYEPFFTDTHRFEFDTRIGVSSVLCYDPLSRVVAVLHPNHAMEKVLFNPWREEHWDVNDTILLDPALDGVTGPFAQRLPDADYLPTWYERRAGGTLGPAEQDAAAKTAVHAGTPILIHADTLGRAFLAVAHNRFERNGALIEERYPTRTMLDIEGNQREVLDAKDRLVMRYDYDLHGTTIHHASMEAGERWTLSSVAGDPVRAWDSRGSVRRFTYDQLRRPAETFVMEHGIERLDTRVVYGESLGDPGGPGNHRTRAFQVFDSAGVVTSQAYDFKGNLLSSRRELLPNYKQAVDWQQNPAPDDGTFTSSTTYDALNRPTAVTAPDNSIYRLTYNEAHLLDKVEVNLHGAAATTLFVNNINYNAKGQRELIVYGNGAETHYEYDLLTFRPTVLRTARHVGLNGLASQVLTDPAVVQYLRYTHDPMGNITRIEDAALQTLFHNNERVQPVSVYTYDAIYRLIEAKGREHIGQTAHDFNPPGGNRRDYPFAGLHAHPNDMQAMRNYTEGYEYDAVGNFQFMRHTAYAGGWTRGYEYHATSLIEPAQKNNRLTKTTVGQGLNFLETYTYTDDQGNDVNGCISAINSLKMVWDSKDKLQQVDLTGGSTAHYIYDGGGQRVRKVIERQNGTRQRERIYLGGFEIYREYNGGGTVVTLERETLHIMDDKQRIALVETRTQDHLGNDGSPAQLIRYQSGNHLGSASLELDEAGQIISYEEYHSYGTSSYQAVRSQTESPKRYRYAGMERDEESGLAYHTARYYLPWLGRWGTCDPNGIEGGIDLYAYSRLNPVLFYDKTGAAPEGCEAEGSLDAGICVPLAAGYPSHAWVTEQQLNENKRYGAELLVTGLMFVPVVGQVAALIEGISSLTEAISGKRMSHIADLLVSNPEGSVGETLTAEERVGSAINGIFLLEGTIEGLGSIAQAESLGERAEQFLPQAVSRREAAQAKFGIHPDHVAALKPDTGVAGTGLASKRPPNNPHGMLGKPSTRALNADIAAELEKEGYVHTGGAGIKEERFPGPNGGRKGSVSVDVTATKAGDTVRVQTVDTLKSGVPNPREMRNAGKILKKDPTGVFLIPKNPRPKSPLR
jgi:RHS repeat-associated protein